MRHNAKGRQLSRTSTHKKAMMRNMAASLFEHEAITTTVAKAKEIRPYAERIITLARRGDLHAIRLVEQKIPNKAILTKLFKQIGPRLPPARVATRGSSSWGIAPAMAPTWRGSSSSASDGRPGGSGRRTEGDPRVPFF